MAYTTIDDPSAYFQTTIYTGNGTDDTAITHGGNSDLQADWVWIKNRTAAGEGHHWYDSVRGVTKRLRSDTTAAESTVSNGLQGFGTNGFTVGDRAGVNQNNIPIVSWNWKETATAGFDMVSYTGNATGGRTIAHSLSAVPKMMIVKNRDADIKWAVYHASNTAAPGTDHLKLNANDATADDDSTWNDTVPTSSVFSVGGSTSTNGDGTAYIAYLFAEKKGYSKFGSYVGNASSNGTFVYTGFKPAFVIFKKSAGTGSWAIQDNKRTPFNEGNKALFADTNAVESTSDNSMDFVSNGFKIRTDTANYNTSGDLYIYMAFAENPLVTSTGIPATAR
jgi:hypothetical protein